MSFVTRIAAIINRLFARRRVGKTLIVRNHDQREFIARIEQYDESNDSYFVEIGPGVFQRFLNAQVIKKKPTKEELRTLPRR